MILIAGYIQKKKKTNQLTNVLLPQIYIRSIYIYEKNVIKSDLDKV